MNNLQLFTAVIMYAARWQIIPLQQQRRRLFGTCFAFIMHFILLLVLLLRLRVCKKNLGYTQPQRRLSFAPQHQHAPDCARSIHD